MRNTEATSSWTDNAGSTRFLPGVLVLFFGSGCAALIYEVVWLELLQLVIGLTTVSLGVLLGTFMGGMCLGSLLLARVISARHHPLRVYALLELGIGVIGIAVLFGMPYLSQVYTAKGGYGFTGFMLRGLVAAVCLLPPTLLMGATLPAVSRWVEATPQGSSWLGFFYGGNIAGAVFGCLLTGFHLLRVHNMATATYVAASINATVALVGFLLARQSAPPALHGAPLCSRPDQAAGSEAAETRNLPSGTALTATAADPSVNEKAGRHEPASWPVHVAIALSGLAALGAEVVWTRLLSLMLGATVYTFSIILAVFLLGLGIGSGAGAFLSRSTMRPRLALGCCQMLLVGAIAWTGYMIACSLPYWPTNPALSLSPWYTFQLDLARCLWAILPGPLLWGASFPLALAAVHWQGRDPGRVVGGVYAANTVGAIIGALSFSLVVIPSAGTQWAQRLLIAVSTTAALLMFVPLRAPSRAAIPRPGRRLRAVSAAEGGPDHGPAASGYTPLDSRLAGACLLVLGTGVAALLAWSVAGVPWGLVAYGRFMATYGNRLAPGITAEKDVPPGNGPPDIFCTYLGEGLNGSVAVTKWTSGVRNFHSAGKVQASTDPRDMRLQRLLGHIAALVHRKPESVLVVACGAGVTAGTFVLYPDVKRIVICDIEPLVPRVVAPMFEKENYGVVNDPRTEVILDDGRHFIRTTREKFDIITSDPIDPWVKGCAALNTVEYYEMCKAHLKPGGVMTLWIPLYESDSETAKSTIATFFKVFPNGILWSNHTQEEGYDAVLFGQVEPIRIEVDNLQARLDREDHPQVKRSLADVGFPSAVTLLATYAGQACDLQPWLSDAQINTDGNLRLQYLAGMSLNSYQPSAILAEIYQYCRFPDQLFVGSTPSTQLLKLAIQARDLSR